MLENLHTRIHLPLEKDKSGQTNTSTSFPSKGTILRCVLNGFQDLILVIHSGNLPINKIFGCFFPFPVSLISPRTIFPGIISQINNLHPHLYLELGWGRDKSQSEAVFQKLYVQSQGPPLRVTSKVLRVSNNWTF